MGGEAQVVNLKLVHLYPAHMNLYGDRGNVLALRRRAEWRHWTVDVIPVDPGEPMAWNEADIVFLGGGEDRHQALIASDLLHRARDLKAALGDGLVFLAICGGFQLLGHRYVAADGTSLPGVGWFDADTRAGDTRSIGNVLTETTLPLEPRTLVGFENHGGKTYLEASQEPLGHVRVGQGNNGTDGTEGAVKGHAIGTYLHGSLLPKNPHLADLLLGWAAMRRTGRAELEPLDDSWELRAHQQVAHLLVRGDR
jgi:CobQ-like glutamine amidotransferase family enzyme